MRNTTISIHGEDVPGVLAYPESRSGRPVIVIQEWWGLVGHIDDVVQRFAAEGFVALAVDHYRGAQTTEPDEAQKLMLGLSIDQVADDLAAAAQDLLQRDGIVGEEVACVGFCMGGGLALLGPTVSDRITRATAFYPAMPWPQYAPDWTRYAGKRAQVHAAESDASWAAEPIARYAAAIVAAGGTAEVLDYPESVHAFFNDDRPEVYQAANAALAWERTLEFLRAE
jgi:carboxymethylenebutenolidase